MVSDYLLANKGNIDTGWVKMIAMADHRRLKDYRMNPSGLCAAGVRFRRG
jgi:hypothetical protein